jgi:hypothetical protein
MTGSLFSFTALSSISAINFYMDGSTIPIRENLVKITMNNLTKYERRMLMYPFFVRDSETPLVVGYFDVLIVIKIFVPKKCVRIRIVDTQGAELDVEGLFFDPSDTDSMLEYNVDKVVTLINGALGVDVETYFKDLHQNSLLDAHREDYEIIPSHIQERSLVNIYLTKLSRKPKTAEGLGDTMWSNDESLWFMGTKINEADKELTIYPTGIKAYSSLMKDDFGIDFVGDSISGDSNTYLHTDATERYYRQWASDSDKLNNPNWHMIWGRFKWAPDDWKFITFIKGINTDNNGSQFIFNDHPDAILPIESMGEGEYKLVEGDYKAIIDGEEGVMQITVDNNKLVIKNG